jgi:sulfopyruvate decarboxylase alpha subunit
VTNDRELLSTEHRKIPQLEGPAWAAGVCAGLFAAGSRHVVYVPDNPLSHVIRILHGAYADVRTMIATREEEAFGIAAGLYLGGARPTVMLQSSGLGNSLNAITSLLVPYQIPVLAIVSMRGDPGEWNAAQVPMGQAVAPICRAIGVPVTSAETAETTAATVQLVGQTAFGTRMPGVCQLPRRITVPVAIAEPRR